MTLTIEIRDAGDRWRGHARRHTVAAALDGIGGLLGRAGVRGDAGGYAWLLGWLEGLGTVRLVGIEGTGSYGAGLTRVLRAAGETVHEVSRPNRRVRRNRGKSDPIDAEVAARNVLAGQIQGAPRAGTGVIESLRQLRATRRSALKARTQAANLLHALLLTAPADIRAELDQGSLKDIVQRCTRLRPGPVSQEREACKFALRSAARRWRHLAEEIAELDIPIAELTAQAAPALLDRSVSAQTWPRPCSSRRVGTRNDSVTRPASLRCAGSVRYQRPRARRTGTGSTAAVTGKRTAPCTPWPWSVCAAIPGPAPTPPDAPARASAAAKSNGASSATSPASSTPTARLAPSSRAA